MESREGDPLPQAPQKPTGFDKNTHAHESSPHLDPFTDQPLDQSLVKDFQKLNFFKDDDGTEEKDNDYLAGSNSIGDNSQYPLRPHAEDCIFYLKTGRCGFGFACKFNHPERKTCLESKDRIFGVEEQEEDDKQRRDFVEKRRQIECKYYLTPQGCKYGKACRYSHSQEKYMIAPSKLDVQEEKEREGFVEQTRLIECKYYGMPGGCKFGKACKYYHFKENVEREPPEVNFLDLPIRPLEKECPFFMRTSSCRYGVDCKYHHPNPISVGGSDLSNSNDNGVVGGDYSLGNCNRIWNTQQPMEPAIPDAASGPPNFVSSDPDAKLDNVSSYASDMHSLLEKMQLKPASNQHQVPIYPQRGPYSSPFGNKQTRIPDVLPNHQDQINGLDFPERPGQPECNYYLVTGNCKYRSACRYHHPKNRASKVAAGACILGNNGLPLRPGKKICGHYERYGICKYGSGCLFDHPENYALPSF